MLKNVPTIGGGQATRTWVSGVGDDANPCSRTAPCKTWAGAISKTIAGGEIDALDPGGFGAVTITKGITLDGAGTLASILAAGTNAVNIAAGANDVVTLRNLTIDGANGQGLNGIRFTSGGVLIVENCVIFNFSQKGIDFEPSATSRLIVIDTVIRNCNGPNTGGGIQIKPQNPSGVGNVLLSNVHIEQCLVGLSNTDRSVIWARNSVFTACTNFGVNATSSAGGLTVINLDSCMLVGNAATANSTAVASVGGNAAVRMNNCTILDNSVGLATANGGFLTTFTNNHIAHNTTSAPPNFTEPVS